MKNKILFCMFLCAVYFQPGLRAQNPLSGNAAGFALFTGIGNISNVNTPRTQIIGNVGANSGAIAGFGNINGQVHVADATTLQASTDVANSYAYLNSTVPTIFPAPVLGSGQTLNPGIYSIALPASLVGNLNLDAGGNQNAIFIIKISGAFSTASGSGITLLNGAKAANVFFKVSGPTTLANNTSFKGSIVSNNSITIGTGSVIEGRALTTSGLISTNGNIITIPLIPGAPLLSGPPAPSLGSSACFEIFSGSGLVNNAGASTNITGNVGANAGGSPTGFSGITGSVEYSNAATAQARVDLINANNSLKAGTLPYDIELLSPSQFGNSLTLTPHVYRLNGNTTLNDSLILDAQGNANAVFVIQVSGNLTTTAGSKVILAGQARASNVFWVVTGNTSLGNNSTFNGTLINDNSAINVGSGATINGRLLTTAGSITYAGSASALPAGNGVCGGPVVAKPVAVKDTASVAINTPKKIGVLANDSNIHYASFNLSIATSPLHGSVALTAGGDSVIYTPTTGYTGKDSLYYKICTGTVPQCDSAWLVINVFQPNRRPIAMRDTARTFRNTQVKIAILSNDTDPDGNVLTASIQSFAANGTVTIINDTAYYLPNPNFTGLDSLRYRICDNQTPSLCDSAFVVIRTMPVNQGGGPGSTFADGNVSTCYALFTSSGSINNTGVTTVVGDVGINNGSISGFSPLLVNGAIHSVPDSSTAHTANDVAAAFNYYDNLGPHITIPASQFASNMVLVPRTYVVNGSANLSDSLTFSAQNNPDALFVIQVNGNFSTSAASRIVLKDSAKAANIIWKVDGTTTLGAGSDFKGTIFGHNNITIGAGTTITGRAFTVSGTIAVNTSSVHIPQGLGPCGAPTTNSPPVAVNDTVTIPKNTITLIDVLANDWDPNGDQLHIDVYSAPHHGTPTVTASQKIRYNPVPGYVGKDSMQYIVCDNGNPELCAVAWIFINVGPNTRPVAKNDTAYTHTNTPVSVNVTANDFDGNGDPLTVSIINGPLHGTAVVTGDSIRYTPNTNYTGWDTLRYRICDNGTPVYCDSALVFINTVTNRAPHAVNDTVSTLRNIPITINVTANDSDPDGDVLTVSLLRAPRNGSFSLVGNNVRYVPNNNYLGIDSFTYRICDTGTPALCDSAWVFVNVVSNRAPFAVDDHVTTLKNTAVVVNVTANDGDPDGQPLTVSLFATPAHGSINLIGNNVRYNPDFNYLGLDSFPYQVCDNGSPTLCDTAWVFVNTVLNRTPKANDDYVTTHKNTPVTVNVTANDNEPDGDPLTVSIIGGPLHGTALVVGINVRYTPATNYAGKDSLHYRICDNRAPIMCDSAWVYINVTDNRAPIAADDYATVLKNTVATINVTANDFDPDGDPLTVTLLTAPKNGGAVLAGNDVRYTPNTNYVGPDSLSYMVCDNQTPSLCDTAWVYINTSSNRKPVAVNDYVTTGRNIAITVNVTANDSDPDGNSLTVGIAGAAKHGSIALISNNIRYTPATGYLGMDSFPYRICDNGSPVLCDSAWVYVNVVANRAPFAMNDEVTTYRNTAININVTANDGDPDGDPLTVSITQNPLHGTATLTSNNVLYTPAPNFTGIDSIRYQVCDGTPGLCAQAWVIIHVIDNRNPIAVADYVLVLKNRPEIINVTANDSDPDGDPLTVSLITVPNHGSATVTGNNVRYVPATNYLGPDSVMYRICDNRTPSLCDSAWVYITVVSNRPPVANDDHADVSRNTTTAIHVTANDSDPDGDAITVSNVSTPKHGSAVISGNNVNYTPTLNYIGVDSFSYRICDSGTPTLCDSAWVYINVVPNRKPVAVDDYVTTRRNMPVTIDVTANDTDPDNNMLSVSLISTPSHGSISLSGKNVIYTPDLNYLGMDSFPYRICDNGAPVMCDTGWVFVNVVLNRAPKAVDDYVTVHKNVQSTIRVTQNDIDPDNDPLTISIITQPAHGTAVVASGLINILYTPNANYGGPDSILYRVCDNGNPSLCDSAWVHITVTDNRAPVAVNDFVNVLKNTTATINVSANDSDPDGDPLTVSTLSPPRHGSFSMAGNNVRYTPNTNYTGIDSFSYQVCDNQSPVLCATAWVYINVVSNRAPVAVDDHVTTSRNVPVTINVTANDSDPDGDPFSATITGTPKHGTVVMVGNNVLYTPAIGYLGIDSFPYSICDNGSPVMCDSAWVFINVVSNRPPMAVNDEVSTHKNTPVLADVLANDSDPDGDPLSVNIVISPLHGTAVLSGNDISYTPSNNYLGNDSVLYQVCDNGNPSMCSVAWLIIHVIDNRPPVAMNDYANVLLNTPQLVDVLANDSDPDGDPLIVTLSNMPLHGTAVVTGNKVLYTPANNFTGMDSLSYRICDNGTPALCDVAWVYLNVVFNRAPVAVNDTVSTLKNTNISIAVTANDYDPDGNTLAVSIVTSPKRGTISLSGNNVLYTPNNNVVGLDSFAYRICDNGNPVMCDSAWVFVNVISNRRPDAVNDFTTTPRNNSVTINPLANDSDPDGDALTLGILGVPRHGTILLLGNTVRYTPNLGYTGMDSLPYRICDNGSPTLCDSAWIFINVYPQTGNRSPVAINDQVGICNDGNAIVIMVQFNDTDPDGDSLSTGISVGPAHGTANLAGKNISYKPAVGYSGNDTVTYYVCDNNIPSLCATAYVIITVNALPASISVPDQHICLGSGIVIGKASVSGNSYRWTPSTGLSSPIESQPFANPVVNTTYTLTETVDATGCENTSTINVVVHALPLALTGPSQNIYDLKSATLGAPPVANHTYSWAPAQGLNFANIAQPVASPTVTTTYSLTETDTLTGCAKTSSVIITVIPIDFYNAFSPNGDGKNDFWRIPIFEVYPSNQVVIFNRWGNEVWATNDYNNTANYFEGKNKNGNELPDGTYYYVINYNNKEERGWVVIKR